MSRQINLYSTDFRRQRKPFSATWMIAALIAGVTLTSAYYALVSQPLPEMRMRRVEAAQQVKTIRDGLVTAGKSVQKTGDKALEDQVARAEAQFKGRQELVGRLQGGEIGNRDGYSKYLLALARRHMDGVWLTNIDIYGPGDEFIIRGRAQRAGQVSEYIKALRQEVGFRGKPIGTLSLAEREIEVTDNKSAAAGSTLAPGAGSPPVGGSTNARGKVRALEFVIGTGVTTVEVSAGR